MIGELMNKSFEDLNRMQPNDIIVISNFSQQVEAPRHAKQTSYPEEINLYIALLPKEIDAHLPRFLSIHRTLRLAHKALHYKNCRLISKTASRKLEQSLLFEPVTATKPSAGIRQHLTIFSRVHYLAPCKFTIFSVTLSLSDIRAVCYPFLVCRQRH